MATVYGSPFKVNWGDKDAVIAYAKKLGRGMSVIQDAGRDTFGITHTSRTDLLAKPGRKIIYQT